MKSYLLLPLCLMAACLNSCFSVSVTNNGNKNATASAPVQNAVAPVSPQSAYVIPKARVYKMYGDATPQNVPIQVSGNEITSFPAPADIIGQEPLQMTNGYLLDRRGISENTRFLRWTYSEYSALKQTPSIAEIKDAIIPNAGIKDLHILNLTLSQALADTAAVNAEIKLL